MSSTVSCLTNMALVYEPKCGGRGGVEHGAQINFEVLTPYNHI